MMRTAKNWIWTKVNVRGRFVYSADLVNMFWNSRCHQIHHFETFEGQMGSLATGATGARGPE